MGDTIAQTGFENVSKTSNDSLLAGVNTPRSDEDSMKLKELMDFCTKLQQRVLDLENTKTAQAQEITSLKLRGRKINDIDKDAEITLVDETQGRYGDDLMFDTGVLDDEETLMEIRSARPKAKGTIFRESDDSTTTTTRLQQQPIKDKAQMQAELEEEDRLVRQRDEEANIVSWDNVQAMIDADYQMAQQIQA
ncbi:hypothetical protein Tco_1446775 [Tanacetum coccineum]